MTTKIVLLALAAAMTVSSAFAQKRDFRKERAELAKQEREERRLYKSDRPKVNYGTNILRVAPITVMDIGVGFGLSYEKIFGAEQMIGLVLPVSVMLENDNNYYFSSNNSNNFSSYFYFTPGIKVYPFGQRKVTYAVGPTLMFGYGGGKQWRYGYDPGSMISYEERVDIKKVRIGMMVSNYVNFNITKSFSLGLEAGVGVRYIDREKVSGSPRFNDATYSNGINATGQFSMTLGYRF